MTTKDECKLCGRQITTGELCPRCAKGNDPFVNRAEGRGGSHVQSGGRT